MPLRVFTRAMRLSRFTIPFGDSITFTGSTTVKPVAFTAPWSFVAALSRRSR
ncbi:MAG: hypothetical protein IPI67_07700 [Myxococcales bacterium]|nr:hypothetical protein [Myxococcales bacterium]